MWKSWILSSLSGAIVAGLILGISTAPFVFQQLPGSGFYWFPLLAIVSGILGSLVQRSVLQQLLPTPLTNGLQTNLGWLICHTLAWSAIVICVSFVTLLSAMAFQRSSFLPQLVTYGVIGTVVGLVIAGVQLLLWRTQLRPQLLWIALSGSSWVACAVLFGSAIVLPYELYRNVLPNLLIPLLTTVGMIIAWVAQSAIVGILLVPAFRRSSF